MTTQAMVWTPPKASFNGKHNKVKAKVLIALYLRTLEGINTGLSVKELAILSGEKHTTIAVNIYRWVRWGLVKQRPGRIGTRCMALYSIGKNGKHYVIYVIPPEIYDKYLNEVKAHQRRLLNVH